MGACYSHIDLKERVKLFDLARSGILSVTELARMLGRNRSTVYREISRNFHNDVYAEFRGWFPITADMRARRRRRKTAKLVRYRALRSYVFAKLKLGWSPEQIAGRLKLEQPGFPIIGYEAIYQFIYSRAGQSLDLYKLLHRHRRRRRKRGGRKPAGSHIPLYCNIKNRPENIAKRDSFGHWEGDLIIFKREHGKKNLTSLVERKTRFQILLPNLDILMAVPALAVAAVAMSGGRWSISGFEGTHGAGLILAMGPAIVLGLRAFQDNVAIDWWLPLVWACPAAILLMLLVAAVERRFDMALAAMTAVVYVAYAWGSFSYLNVALDDLPSKRVAVRVLEATADDEDYQLTLERWASLQAGNRVDVSRATYKQAVAEKRVCIDIYPGALTWPWYKARRCSTTD